MQDSQGSVLSELIAQLLAALFGIPSAPPPISFEVAALEEFASDRAGCAEGAFGLSRDGGHDVVCFSMGGFVGVKATDGSGAERISNTGLLNRRRDRAPVISDMNGDGRLDLVVLADTPEGYFDWTYAPCELAVLLGDGAGGFTQGPSQALQHAGLGLGSGDFDEDGAPDIVAPYGLTASTRALGATVLLNRPGVQLELNPYRDEAGSSPEQGAGEPTATLRVASDVLVFDANGDQHSDVVFAAAAVLEPGSQSNGTLHTLLGDGQGGLRAGPSVDLGMWGGRFSVTAGDYDEDGYRDVVVALVRFGNYDESLELPKILFGSRDGGFSEPIAVPPTEASADLHSVDYDGDGHLDLITAGREGPIHVYTGLGDGSFAQPMGFAVGRDPRWLTTLDFELDGTLDVLALTANGLERVALSAQAEALGAPRVHSFIVQDSALSSGSRSFVSDFDGDSDSDIVCTHSLGALALLNDGAGGFRALDVALFAQAPGPRVYRHTAGDVNGDGLVDLMHAVTTDFSVADLRIHLQQPDGTWRPMPPIRSAIEQLPEIVAFADANGDDRVDLFEVSSPSPLTSLAIHVQGADGELSQLAATSFEGEVVNIEDVDADGCSDVWVHVGDYLGIMTADCEGGFKLDHFVALPRDARGFEYADMNDDGRKDFVSGQGIALASASGDYEQAVILPGDFLGAIWAVDLNGDGLRDVALSDTLLSGPELVTLTGDGRGGLGSRQVVLPTPTSQANLRFADLAGDALPDALRVDVYAPITSDRPEQYRGVRGALVELTIVENVSAR